MPLAADAALAQPPHVVVVAAATRWHTVTVRPGDTIWQLAIDHHATVQALVEKNRLARGGEVIFVGQKLLVPGPGAAPAPAHKTTPSGKTASKPKPRTTATYTVRPGDTLSDIAARHNVSLAALVAANRITNPGVIHPGQRVAIPGTARTEAAAQKAPAKHPAPAPSSDNTFAGYTYSDAIVGAAKKNRDTLARRDVPSRTETADLIRKVATRYGVDPRLALAISWQESGWNQRVVSVANAVGTMQVIPSSGQWASELAGRKLDLLDTEDNITAGVVIIKALLRGADDREQAIAGYYQGLHSVQANGLYEDTKGYVAAVLTHYKRM
ncbi:MAG: LysM peptidoglycan-binding domain-containing protein [Intrasporangium sp.]|uniref:lytic transglycosylase n=1 Tax=Intrasporangium sp. TaxID=1925024 RepID=UPI003F7D32FC